MKCKLLSLRLSHLPLPQTKRSCDGGTNDEKEIALSWPTDSRGGKDQTEEETGCCSSPMSLFKSSVNHLDGPTLSSHARLCHIGRKIVWDLIVLHKQMG